MLKKKNLVCSSSKSLKTPLINTSDGPKAVIFENNSKIILPDASRLSPGANTDTPGSEHGACAVKAMQNFVWERCEAVVSNWEDRMSLLEERIDRNSPSAKSSNKDS